MTDAYARTEITEEGLVTGMRQMAVAFVEQDDFLMAGEPVVYVMGFANGVTKVGQTADLATRQGAHISNKRVRGHGLVSNWWMRTNRALEDEKFLKDVSSKVLGGVAVDRTREWFTGVDPDLLIAVAIKMLSPAPKPPLSYYFPDWGPEDFPPKP